MLAATQTTDLPDTTIGREILVLVDPEDSGGFGLFVPFLDARVIEVAEGAEIASLKGTFQKVVIHHRSVSNGLITSIAGTLQVGGDLVIVLPETEEAPSWDEGLAWPGMVWSGVEDSAAGLCAVLRRTDSPPSDSAQTIRACLLVASVAFRLGSVRSRGEAAELRARNEILAAGIAAASERRRNSELALLDRIEPLVDEVKHLRSQQAHDKRSRRRPLIRRVARRLVPGKVIRLIRSSG